MGFVRKDHFHKKAKKEGYRSRAVFKLQEIQKRFRIFRRGGKVLDLGAAPGGWLQVASEFVKREGKVVGIDRLPIEPLPLSNVTILEGDLLDPEVREEALATLGGHAEVVMSDMAPNLTGVRVTDCVRSFELSMLALNMARQCLSAGGSFVAKIFPGDEFETFLHECRSSFRKVRTTKPEATRKSSSEVYVIALDFKALPSEETESSD
ncbi:MAG: RlmE family RNA methyltransferase [Deltaproteobacteria bacterium]|nr:MAG: RlmE family RNA methyltransferase [Deltaproteobacteria bacterium]